MEPNEASTRLRALAKDDKMRPETARLRDIFDDVETALKAGVSQVNVLAELKTLGYTMTLASFKSALQRIRKERNKEGKAAPQAEVNSPASPVLLDSGKQLGKKEGNNENLNETNPLRKLSGNSKPGEFNPIPTAKIEFD